MYLACTLKDNGCDLAPKKKEAGPDIEVRITDSPSIWVEAIVATSGIGKDSVPLPKKLLDNDIDWFCIPEEPIVLRYTNAIYEKYKKYVKYKINLVITGLEPYVIAVNGDKVPYAWDTNGEIPYIVQAVLPFGSLTVDVNYDVPGEAITSYAYRPEIIKVSGMGVPTNIFLRKEYEGISGVLFSRSSILRLSNRMGEDFIFVHNPLALNKLPEGWLKVGREYRVNGSFLECRCWSK
jgi:type I restriction enzyme S subunit